MIAHLIRWSVRNRFLVVIGVFALVGMGIWAVRSTPIDALPDLSDTQVIIRTSYPGQAPQIVENQVTYPLTTTMLSVPGAKTVRGYSFFGDSFVYVIFEDGTDLYWARSRVLEYLNQVQGRLPASTRSALGPDATGVGWVYEYALVDKSGRHDLSQLRSLQDWFLRYELKTVPGVAEIASIGGMVKQYQVLLDPVKLAAYGITHAQAVEAIQKANQEAGGSVLEMGEAEYMIRASGYLKTLDDFRAIPLRTAAGGVPVTLGDVATIQIGPEMRRGIAELNGEGEVAGGIVILRSGKNARETIAAVKDKLDTLKSSLPPGVEVITTYDRSQLIDRAVENLTHKLLEEFVVVAIVCALFLWHVRSALVAIFTLPLGVLAAFVVMRFQGVNADIMSLGGIAIAIGAMVDAAVVMIENAHKKIEHWEQDHPSQQLDNDQRWMIVTDAAAEVGPALFFSLLIITLSFVPIFTLQGQEGRLFAPLAFTKTYAMAAAAILSVTLVPILMGWLIRGRIPAEQANPINRWLTHTRFPREPHVGDIARAQIDFGRRPGPFHHHQIALRLEPAIARHDFGQEIAPCLAEIGGPQRPAHLAMNDQLRGPVGLRLEQHRVHIGVQRRACGQSLQRLRPADFATVFCHRGIVGHILRLERQDTQSAIGQRPAQARDQNRFANVRTGALQHQTSHAIPPAIIHNSRHART